MEYIGGFTQLILALGFSINALVGLMTFLQSRTNGKINTATSLEVAKVSKDMAELAVNTNSIKDALVVSEKKVSFNEGQEQVRSERAELPLKVDIVKLPIDLPKA